MASSGRSGQPPRDSRGESCIEAAGAADPTDCGHWAPSEQRLACEGFGVTDPSRNGIYTIQRLAGVAGGHGEVGCCTAREHQPQAGQQPGGPGDEGGAPGQLSARRSGRRWRPEARPRRPSRPRFATPSLCLEQRGRRRAKRGVVVNDQNGRAQALIVAEAEPVRIVGGRNPEGRDVRVSTAPRLLPAPFRGWAAAPRFDRSAKAFTDPRRNDD